MLRAALLVMCISSVGYADTAETLRALGKRAHPTLPGSTATCTVPSKAEATALKNIALAWIDKQFPDGTGVMDGPGVGFVFAAGCKDLHSAYVSISQDRTPKHGDRKDRINAVLKITGDSVEPIASRTTANSEDWMEWADEGGYSIVAMVDNKLVWSDDEHEGGATSTYANLKLQLANGTTAPIARVKNRGDVRIVDSGTIMHATPTGVEKLDRTLVAECARPLALRPAEQRRQISRRVADSRREREARGRM